MVSKLPFFSRNHKDLPARHGKIRSRKEHFVTLLFNFNKHPKKSCFMQLEDKKPWEDILSQSSLDCSESQHPEIEWHLDAGSSGTRQVHLWKPSWARSSKLIIMKLRNKMQQFLRKVCESNSHFPLVTKHLLPELFYCNLCSTPQCTTESPLQIQKRLAETKII